MYVCMVLVFGLVFFRICLIVIVVVVIVVLVCVPFVLLEICKAESTNAICLESIM